MISAPCFLRSTAAMFALLWAAPLCAAGAPLQSRLAAAISGSERTTLGHSAEPRARTADDLGAAPGNTVLPEMVMRFSMTATQQTELDSLIAEQQNPRSPLFEKWITPEAFASRFGMSDSDLAKVCEWLTVQGFTVTQTGRARNFISFRGTVAQAQAAFGTQMHLLRAEGETHVANISDITLPTALAQTVLTVQGLSDFAPRPHYTNASGTHFVVPEDVQMIYNAKSAMSAGYTGAGVTIVVPGQADIDLSNVITFRSLSGLPAKTVKVVQYAAARNGTGDTTESYADLEWAGAMAPAADLVFVASSNVYVSLQYAIDNDLGSIISMSYGTCEGILSTVNKDYLNAIGQEANALGITVVTASGDSGATDCEVHGVGSPASATTGLSVDMPASSPYYFSVGGTLFNDGAGSYWDAANSSTLGSAKGYIPEVAWNESSPSIPIFATGGGASSYFSKPSWQSGPGVPTDGKRDVPDVALNSGAHDAYLVCLPGYCANGFRNTSGSVYGIAGTSLAAPNMAGILALVVQKTAARIGNPNPRIYSLAVSNAAPTVFHDVTAGDNKVACTTGAKDCPSGGSIGYTAGVGYDLVTGWGSIDAANLVNTWSLSGNGSSSGIGGNGILASSTSLSASASVGSLNSNLDFTAKVAGSGAAPSGMVYYVVNGTTVDFAALNNGALTRTLALTTAYSFQPGDNVVQVRYSGDSNYAASVSANIHAVVTNGASSSASDFVLSPASDAITMGAGSTATLNYSVTSSNGFAGSIAFTIASTNPAFQSCAKFAPSSVALSATSVTAGTGLTLKTASCGSTAARLDSHIVGSSSHHRGWGGAALAALVVFLRPRKRRLAPILCAALVLAGLGGLNGCGAGGDPSVFNGGGTTTAPVINSPAGTYDLVIAANGTNAAGTAVSKIALLKVIVQ